MSATEQDQHEQNAMEHPKGRCQEAASHLHSICSKWSEEGSEQGLLWVLQRPAFRIWIPEHPRPGSVLGLDYRDMNAMVLISRELVLQLGISNMHTMQAKR